MKWQRASIVKSLSNGVHPKGPFWVPCERPLESSLRSVFDGEVATVLSYSSNIYREGRDVCVLVPADLVELHGEFAEEAPPRLDLARWVRS